MRRSLFFFVYGLALGSLCLLMSLYWLELCRIVFDRDPLIDGQSSLLTTLGIIPLFVPLVAAILVFVWRAIAGPAVKATLFATAAFVPHIFLVFFAFAGPPIARKWHAQEFDAVKWRSESVIDFEKRWPTRLCMVDDLLKDKKLVGLSRRAVEQMLGPGVISPAFPRTKNEIAYYLGPQRDLWRGSSEFLTVRFDSGGIVSDYSVETD